MDPKNVLFTGGSGLLGTEIKKLLPDVVYPSSAEFDVTNFDQMVRYVSDRPFNRLVHAAAMTSPPRCDGEPLKALEANIIGTANIVRLCAANSIHLIYISTDYVFSGETGMYKEDDPVCPVNKYAWSKLGGECCVRMYDKSLIVRTSFGPNEFPYPAAFMDQWTSRQSVSDIAKKIAKLVASDLTGIVHVGGPRRTVFEYAQSLDATKSIGKISIGEVHFKVPEDTSLDCSKYDRMIAERQ